MTEERQALGKRPFAEGVLEPPVHLGRRTEVIGVRVAEGRSALLKLLRTPQPSVADMARLRREFELPQRLDPRFILRPTALTEHAGRAGLLFDAPELAGAQTLRQRLRQGPLDPQALLRIALDLVDALQHLHAQGLIHRDLGLGQVVLLEGAGSIPGRVRVADLGLAAEIDRERPLVQKAELIEASLATLAPELTGRMSRDVDYRADLYSFGASLLEALTGAPPFPVNDPASAVHAHLALPAPLATRRNPRVFAPLAAVVAHCLNKEPEARYQSHQALRQDLQLCLAALEQGRALPGFTPARGDIALRFQASGRLYGREAALQQLAQAFEQAAHGQVRGAGLVAIAGFSGIGKTALVLASQRSLLAQQGHFAAAKFNQYGQDRPYGALLHLLAQRAAQVLALPEALQAPWRERLQALPGPNAAVLAGAVPELLPLLQPVQALVPVGPTESENRFLRTVSQGFAALARDGEPQTFFLDDWQWADRASRRLLRECLGDASLTHSLFILAYRDNEVRPGHPIAQELQELRQQLGERFTPLRLGPLGLDDSRQLLADSLHRAGEPDDAALLELASLCQARTGGNPFFMRRLMEDLWRRGLFHFDAARQRWTFLLERIAATRMADNVVALMLEQLEQLPEATCEALSVAALLGATVDLESLSTAMSADPTQLAQALLPALQAQLLVPASALYRYGPQLQGQASDDVRYAFAHDRVQEAALQRMAAASRTGLHLRIGRLLRQRHQTQSPQQPLPYAVLNHLNAARMLLRPGVDDEERSALAEANRAASRRALEAAAFEPAADYADVALELAPEGPAVTTWRHHAARAAYLAGRPERMESLLTEALAAAATPAERARLLEVRMEAFYAQGRLADTVSLGLELFELLGAALPQLDPGQPQADLARMLRQLREDIETLGIDTLAAQAPMQDEGWLLQISIAAKMTAAAYIVRPALLPLLTVFQVRLMVDHGHVPQALSAYSVLGLMCAEFLADYHFSHAIGRMTLLLVERHGWVQAFAHAGFSFHSFLSHWVDGLASSMDGLMQTHRNGLEFGNFRHAGLGLYVHDVHAFLSGQPLPHMETMLDEHVQRLQAMRQPVAQDYTQALLALVRALRQSPFKPAELPGLATITRTYQERQDLTGLMFLHGWQAVIAWVGNDPATAWRHAIQSRELFAAGRGMHAQSLFLFIAAWANQQLALQGEAPRDPVLVEQALTALTRWNDARPGHLSARLLLLKAQACEGDAQVDALLAQALIAAQAPGQPAMDRAAVLRAQADAWAHRHPDRAAQARQDLQQAWQDWGMTVAVVPAVSLPSAPPPSLTEGLVSHASSDPHLGDAADLSSLIKAVQAISSQPDLAALLRRLLEVVAENAGAQRAAVVLASGTSGASASTAAGASTGIAAGSSAMTPAKAIWPPWVLQGEVCMEGPVPVHLQEQLALDAADHQLPTALMREVLRTGQRLWLPDASTPDQHPWFRRGVSPARSVLILPLLKQGQTVGALYLENRAVAGVFTEARVSFLELLCANVVSAVDNARLVAELRDLNTSLEQRVAQRTQELVDSEERLRAVLDNAPMPMVVTRLRDGLIVYGNGPSVAIGGHSLEGLVGKPAFSFYRDPVDRDRIQQRFREQGRLQSEEVCLLAADGSERWMLLSMVPVRYDGEPSVLSTLVDFTERKRLEIELQRLATTDALTGAFNRRCFMERAEAELARSRRYGAALSLVMMDVDHFKRINDTLGHARGDDALCRVVQVCAQLVRKQDVLGRVGGEEFALLLPQTSLEEAHHLVERLRERIASSRMDDGHHGMTAVVLTASFGVTGMRPDDTSIDDLLGRADEALYRAKAAGRNRVERAA
ncbi:diguanylate cyclase [Roseateles sp. SL47]|uniref:diguanylate cyclase n=1 Tax=Roseateles sp. SL47 TaxID=2995138 RepID=UPI002270E34E|nr:diguanylate cyclase [Roseateles sp. SL47]WAC74093.1 diguanylate cyclase [Roseateles sp. SL47]